MSRLPRTLLLSAVLLPALAHAGFSVSSARKGSSSVGSGAYEAASALDGKPETAWHVNPEEKNEGQWIELDVPRGKVDKLSLIVGWQVDDDTWADHARVKSVRVEVTSMAGGEPQLVLEKELTFEDKQGRQTLDLPDPQVGDELEGGRVRVVVTGVYPGKDYEHLAVGEVLVHMVEFDATLRKFADASSSAEGHDGAALVDDSTKTFWASADGDEAPAFSVNAGKFSASSIGITPGPSSHARPKKIRLTQSDAIREYEVPDKAGLHWFELPALFGYTGSNFGDIRVEVLESYPGSASASVAVADVKFKATALEPF